MVKLVFMVFLIFISCFSTSAQEPYSQHFSQANGLPSNSVYSIIQDKKGFIWFTCDEGLFRYDGTYFKSYRSAKQTSYSGSSILEDVKGRIWYLDFDGNAFYIQDDKLKRLKQKSTVNFYQLKATSNYIFIQEQSTIAAVDLSSLKVVKRFKTKNFVYASATLSNDFYFIDGNYLFKINQNLTLSKVNKLTFLANEFPILLAANNQLLLTKKNSQNNGVWSVEKEIKQLKSISGDVIVQNAKLVFNQVHLITTQGICIPTFTKNKIDECFFKGKNTSDIIADHKGNYWVTSNNDGIDIVPNMNVKCFQFKTFSPLRVRAYNNKLLVSSKNEQIAWFSPTTKTFETFSTGTSNAQPYYLFIDTVRNHVVSVKSDGYTYFMDLETKQPIAKFFLAIKHISQLDNKYNLFVASGFSGFYCHKNDLSKKSEYDRFIQKIKPRQEGNFYFFQLNLEGRGKFTYFDNSTKSALYGTNLGIFKWQKGQITKVKLPKYTGGITSLFLLNNQLFGLSIDGRIVTFSDKSKKIIPLLANLEKIKQIKTKERFLFVRFANQLSVFEQRDTGGIRLLNHIDLSGIEITDFAMLEEEVWFMTSHGFVSWIYKKKHKNKANGIFRVTSILVGGEEVNKLDNIKIKHTQNSLKLDFALLDFGNSTISGLGYKLNNSKLIPLEKNIRSINFPAIASGSYTLQILAKINDEFKVLELYHFEITPPFWSTNWFYALIFSLVLGIIILYYRNKIKRSEVHNRLIQEKISLESSLNKSLLASIKSQMNPHFIFNALNTIQAYIFINDKQNASTYLSKFSKLTRSVLEMSEKDTIPLAKEIETLKLYLDLEKMRFQENFSYSFETEDLDIHSISIPSMLLQPYIENAIKHGLLHLEGEKILSIKMSVKDDVLIVSIDDNGIGRKRSEELRVNREKNHLGFSTQANEKRLNIMHSKDEISVQYIDKIDENSQAIGTTVVLKIKI